MRDTFLLVWVGFLLIGVIGSIVSSARKQAQQSQRISTSSAPARSAVLSEAARPSRRAVPAPAQRVVPSATPSAPKRVILSATPNTPKRTPVVPQAPAAPAPVVEPLQELATPQHRTHRFFRSRQAIVQAVIAAEVLGKPRALRDEYL